VRRLHAASARAWWRGLTGRTVLVTCLVAAVSVLITSIVAVPLALRTARAESRVALADRAQVAANVIEGTGNATALKEQQRALKVARTLRAQGVEAVLIREGVARPDTLPAELVADVAAGQPVSTTITHKGRMTAVEGRSSGEGDGIVLLQPVLSANAWQVVNRLALASLAGLLAGLVAGFVLARRLARPIRAAASAATRLSAGERDVRLPVPTTTEAGDLARALNNLAAALATSEGRQRAFLMSISHELRTPLTTIKGYAEALADGVVGPDGAPRAGATVLAEAEHLDRLVSDLLVLARLEADDFPLEVTEVDLASLVTTAAEVWGGRCAAVGVVLRTELADLPVIAVTDPGRVRQVIDGLLENALRVVPPGAPAVLAVRPGGAFGTPDEPTLSLPVAGARSPFVPTYGRSTASWSGPVRPHAVLEVRDGGPGFTDDDLAVAFERGALYERYRGVRKVGSGLGLALAARLVARLGGQIEADHAPEGGACFTVRLPSAR
jgi:signal transduction histidine kinase